MPPPDPEDALYDRCLAQHGMVHTGEGTFVYQGTGAPVDTTDPDVLSRFRQVHAQAQQQLAERAQSSGDTPGGAPLPETASVPMSQEAPPEMVQMGARALAGPVPPDTAFTNPMALLERLLASPARSATLKLIALLGGGSVAPTPNRMGG